LGLVFIPPHDVAAYLHLISCNVSAVATPMNWTLKALLLGGAHTQRIGVVPARATTVNGIRLDVFPSAALHRLLCYVKSRTFLLGGRQDVGLSELSLLQHLGFNI